jgi:hypothetical protein
MHLVRAREKQRTVHNIPHLTVSYRIVPCRAENAILVNRKLAAAGLAYLVYSTIASEIEGMLAPGPDMEEVQETIEKIVRTAARNEVGWIPISRLLACPSESFSAPYSTYSTFSFLLPLFLPSPSDLITFRPHPSPASPPLPNFDPVSSLCLLASPTVTGVSIPADDPQSAPKSDLKKREPNSGMTYIFDPTSAGTLVKSADIPIVTVPAPVLMTSQNHWYAGAGEQIK